MDVTQSTTSLMRHLVAASSYVQPARPDPRSFEERMIDLATETEQMAGYACGHDVPTDAMYTSAEMVRLIPQLFEKIKHGEPGHEAWLKEAIECHFLGKPMPEYVAK